MIGRALNGRYELVEILGVGGMATVWRGHDRVLGRQVAVKVLNGGLADEPRFAERFGREAQHAAMLAHPRIAMVFDSGVDQGSPYIVMELVQGRPLSQLIAETGGFTVDRAVGIATAVCEALEVAHAAGLVHRDIKPGNIMITDDGGVKVVDFGIARASSSSAQLTQTATVLGTAAYLSPEQATAAEVDGRADLYAVGCVLVEMLTGEPPFTAETPVAIAFKHVTEQPAPVSVRRPDVPPALDVAVLRLLAKDPGVRPAGAGAARAELLAAVPAAGPADRTTELLAATRAMRPVDPHATFPTGPAAGPVTSPPYADSQRTSVLPPLAPPLRTSGPPTSMMPPLAPLLPASPAERPTRRRPLVLAAICVAAVAGVAAIVAVALSGSDGGGSGTAASATTPPAAASAPAPDTTSSATPAAKPGVAGALAALRAGVAQTQFAKEKGQKDVLLGLLDEASNALADDQPQDAEQALRNAQKLVHDLNKKHAVDGGTGQSWQNRLGSLINALHGQVQGTGQVQGGAGDGNN